MRLVKRTATGGFAIPSGVKVRGRIQPPPSKSITQRALNLALLARSPMVIRRPLVAEDTRLFLAALQPLGFRCRSGEEQIELEPAGPVEHGTIWCGNNGTMLRFLTGALTTVPGIWSLDGSNRLRQRPIGPLVEALRSLGADIRYEGSAGFAPLAIKGGELTGGEVTLDAGLSSQFVSSMLMAATRARDEVVIRLADLVSMPYLRMTLEVMVSFGADCAGDDEELIYRVRPSSLGRADFEVEADFSSAAYPAAAAVLTGGVVRIEGLGQGSSQGDREFVDVLEAMGGESTWRDGALEIRSNARLTGVDVDLSGMPDQVMTLAVMAPFAAGSTRIRNVRHLRIKESDRLAAMADELRRMGALVEETEDGLEIEGCWADRSQIPSGEVRIDTHGDHRVAMSLAVSGLVRPAVIIGNPEVVAKSYPSFWDDFDSLLHE